MSLRTRRITPPTGAALAEMRREAWNPATRPARLTQLAGNVHWVETLDRRVAEGLAGNPSTPPEVLARVVMQAPLSFCRNPAVSLLALAMPEFCGTLPAEGLALVLRSPRAPGLIVAQACGLRSHWYAGVAEDAALHVSQCAEVADAEWSSEVRRYWETAIQRTEEPEEEYEDSYGFSPASSLRELAEHALIPHELVEACPLEDPLP